MQRYSLSRTNRVSSPCLLTCDILLTGVELRSSTQDKLTTLSIGTLLRSRATVVQTDHGFCFPPTMAIRCRESQGRVDDTLLGLLSMVIQARPCLSDINSTRIVTTSAALRPARRPIITKRIWCFEKCKILVCGSYDLKKKAAISCLEEFERNCSFVYSIIKDDWESCKRKRKRTCPTPLWPNAELLMLGICITAV